MLGFSRFTRIAPLLLLMSVVLTSTAAADGLLGRFCNRLLAGPSLRHERIVTERLVLRPLSPMEFDQVKEIVNAPLSVEMNGGRFSFHALIQAVQNEQVRRASDPWRMIWFGVRLKDEPELIGIVQLARESSQDRIASVGYSFDVENWGRGYATESLEAVVDYAFEDLKLKALMADTLDTNFGSMRVLEKAGFENLGLGFQPNAHGRLRNKVFFRRVPTL